MLKSKGVEDTAANGMPTRGLTRKNGHIGAMASMFTMFPAARWGGKNQPNITRRAK